MALLNRVVNAFALNVVRPWALRDLPGWGRLVKLFVENRGDAPWEGAEPVWGRGTMHGYEQLLDLKSWPSRWAYFTGRYYDIPTQQLLGLMLKPGHIFVDIGANEGMLSLLASRLVGDHGKVIAFEPNPIPRAFLDRAIDRNSIRNIQVVPYGVASEQAVLPLHVPKANSGEGSFGAPARASGETYTIECEVRPADYLLSHITPTLIKIDVEGFELGALEGIRETIGRTGPPVIMEMIGEHLHRAGSSVARVRQFMEIRGYRARRIDWGLKLNPVAFSESMAADVLWTRD